jgi:hypothetical protein
VRDHGTIKALRDAVHRDPERRPPRPPFHPEGIPADLAELPQWVVWRYTWVSSKRKWDKHPRTTRGGAARSNDPATWATFAEALAAYQTDFTLDGLGFVFRAGGGRFGLDLDSCRDPDTAELSDPAQEILGRFPTYAEVSPSGFGFKLLGLGEMPGGRGRKNPAADLEIYPSGRYFALTGLRLPASPGDVRDCSTGLAWLWERFFPARRRATSRGTRTAPTTTTPTPSSAGTGLSDDEVLDWLFRRDPKATAISRLWHGDTSDHAGDHSAADMALVNHIAFYAGPDRRRIDALFRQAPLCRDKWDARRGDTTYGWWTIDNVLGTKTTFFEPRINVTMKMPHTGTNSRDSRDASVGGQTPPAGWGPPAPLPTMPPVPPFPLDAFPPAVADYWRAAAESLAVPVDYVAVPGLALLGAAVGRSRAAEVKPGYAESPLFWVAVIAPPGGTKSSSLGAARAPLQTAEADWIDKHRGEMSLFDTEMDRHNARVKEWKAGGCAGEPPQKPHRPTLRQATLDDATTEAVAKVLADNPRGVIVVKDELSGFVRSMDQYKGGRGADRQFWLSAWAGAPAKVNRAKDHDAGPLVIPHPFAAVAGMMCPDSLAELRGEDRHGEAAADGFLDRFLFSFPDPLPAGPERWLTIPEPVAKGYCDVFLDLLGMEMVPITDGPAATTRYRPYFVGFSRNGRAAWEEFTGNVADRMNALDPFDPFRGVLSKLRGYGARFAALLWSVRRVCGLVPTDGPIDAGVMVGAAALVDNFERHAARALGRGWADRPSRVARRLLAWLARHPERGAFTRTEAFIALKDRRDVRTSEALAPAFRLLVDHNYLRPLERPENARPGPIPETYTVNPLWDRSTPG